MGLGHVEECLSFKKKKGISSIQKLCHCKTQIQDHSIPGQTFFLVGRGKEGREGEIEWEREDSKVNQILDLKSRTLIACFLHLIFSKECKTGEEKKGRLEKRDIGRTQGFIKRRHVTRPHIVRFRLFVFC